MATVVHPRLDRRAFIGMQLDTGWGLSAELICSEAVVIPPVGPGASFSQGELHVALRSWQEGARDGGLVLQDVFVDFGDDILAPDIAWWRERRRPPLTPGAVQVVPDLVVEVLSPATRSNDLGVKRDIYVARGVGELWLVDPIGQTVTRARPDCVDETLDRTAELSSAQLPGFSLALARVFGT